MVLVPLWLNLQASTVTSVPPRQEPQGIGGGLLASGGNLLIFRAARPIDLFSTDVSGIVEPQFKTKATRELLVDTGGASCCCGTPDDGCVSESACVSSVTAAPYTSMFYGCLQGIGECDALGQNAAIDCNPVSGSFDDYQIVATRCCKLTCPPDEINLYVRDVSTGRDFSFQNAAIRGLNAYHGTNNTAQFGEFTLTYQLCDAGEDTTAGEQYQVQIGVTWKITRYGTLQGNGECLGAWPLCGTCPAFVPGQPPSFGEWALQLDIDWLFHVKRNATLRDFPDDCCSLLGGETIVLETGSIQAFDEWPTPVPEMDMTRIASDEISPWLATQAIALPLEWGSSEIIPLGTVIPWNGIGCDQCTECG